MKSSLSKVLGATAFVSFVFAAATGQAADERAAKALAKDNNCFKCHSVSREKSAPSFKAIAAKLKGKPDAVAILTKHLTTSPMVKVDGKEEKHEMLKASPGDMKNLIDWILSR